MKSIKARLVFGLLLGFALLLGLGGIVVYSAVRKALVAQFDAQLHSEAMGILSGTKQERRDIEVEFSDRYRREYDEEVGTRFYQITRPDGKIEERSDSLGKNELPKNFGTQEVPLYYDLALPSGAPGRALAFRFVPRSEAKERRRHDATLELGLVVAGNRKQLDATLAAIRRSMAGVGILAAFGALAVVGMIVSDALGSLKAVGRRVAEMDVNDLSQRLPKDNLPLELAPFCDGLNDLLRRLEASMAREKQFSSDLAHELRTPIAELRSLSEVALKWPEAQPNTPAAFNDALGIARQMDGIVSSLLAISRCEAGKQALARKKINVRAVVDENWRPLEETARLRQLNVSFQVPSEAEIETDESMFGLILKNLLENAVQYTPRRGSIRLRWEGGGKTFALAVANETEDLVAEDVPHLFERFWRKESARSGSQHSGLGLALARAYARTLGHRLEAELVGKDIVFTLRGRVG